MFSNPLTSLHTKLMLTSAPSFWVNVLGRKKFRDLSQESEHLSPSLWFPWIQSIVWCLKTESYTTDVKFENSVCFFMSDDGVGRPFEAPLTQSGDQFCRFPSGAHSLLYNTGQCEHVSLWWIHSLTYCTHQPSVPTHHNTCHMTEFITKAPGEITPVFLE